MAVRMVVIGSRSECGISAFVKITAQRLISAAPIISAIRQLIEQPVINCFSGDAAALLLGGGKTLFFNKKPPSAIYLKIFARKAFYSFY